MTRSWKHSYLTLLSSNHALILAPVTTYGGSHGQSDCIFPFGYNGTSHKQCVITADRKLPWCATSANYSAHEHWGYCQGTTSKRTNLGVDLQNPFASTFASFSTVALFLECIINKIYKLIQNQAPIGIFLHLRFVKVLKQISFRLSETYKLWCKIVSH